MEDLYAYYVLIIGISENIFWNSDFSDILTIVEDKQAYDGWADYERQKMIDRERN